jgi:hypothetical protein
MIIKQSVFSNKGFKLEFPPGKAEDFTINMGVQRTLPFI